MEEVVSVSNPSQESLNQENETNKSMGDMDRLWRTMPKHNKKKKWDKSRSSIERTRSKNQWKCNGLRSTGGIKPLHFLGSIVTLKKSLVSITYEYLDLYVLSYYYYCGKGHESTKPSFTHNT